MSGAETIPSRRCTDCLEHGTVVTIQAHHGKILDHLVKKMDAFMVAQISMLVGVILCLMAGLVSVYFSYESQHANIQRTNEYRGPVENFGQYAILTIPLSSRYRSIRRK